MPISKPGQKILRAPIPQFRFKVINDGSTNDDNKLGAIGDINLVLTRENATDSDLLVIAGDNLFRESLHAICGLREKKRGDGGCHEIADAEAIKKYGVVAVDAGRVITHFEEKPKAPKSNLAAIALVFLFAECAATFHHLHRSWK